MQDLRVHSVDGDYLVLQAADGTTFRVLIDDDLRKAARREAITDSDAAIISPRDIQLEIRAGFTVEQLAANTGASIEYIQKFAAPVIDELAHVVSSALAVRITIAGDRYNDTAQVEFGELISNRLAGMGVASVAWSSRRSDNGGWQLNCKFDDSVAIWAFDPRKLSLSPENELAIQLSTQQVVTDGPIPKLRPVLDAVPATLAPKTAPVTKIDPVASTLETPTAENLVIRPNSVLPNTGSNSVISETPANVTADLGQTADYTGVVPFGRNVSSRSVGETKTPTASTPAQPVAVEPAAPAPVTHPTGSLTPEQDDLTNTADLLEALRRKRLTREQEIEAEVAKANAIDDNLTEEVDLTQTQEVSTDTKPNPVVGEAPPAPKKGRSSVPSWDEIVFGTKTED